MSYNTESNVNHKYLYLYKCVLLVGYRRIRHSYRRILPIALFCLTVVCIFNEVLVSQCQSSVTMWKAPIVVKLLARLLLKSVGPLTEGHTTDKPRKLSLRALWLHVNHLFKDKVFSESFKSRFGTHILSFIHYCRQRTR